jgi:hypothetical protein
MSIRITADPRAVDKEQLWCSKTGTS